MRQLIFHSIRMRKVQSASILISIALSAALFLVLGGIYGGVTQGISLSAERSGADLLVVPADARSYLDEGELLYTGVPVPMYMDEDVMDAIRGLEGVERATAQFFSQTLNASCCSATDETRLVGINLDDDFIVSPLLPDGFGGQLADDEVIVGSQVDGIVDGVLHIYGKPYRVAATMAESGGGSGPLHHHGHGRCAPGVRRDGRFRQHLGEVWCVGRPHQRHHGGRHG